MSGKLRIGVFGAYRGKTMVKFCVHYPDAELVAVCDKYVPALEECKKLTEGMNLKTEYYTNFEDFIKHDMDAVVLANYANEHAPFAIRCLDKGLHVISEVLPCQTLAEGVSLVEAVERSGRVYAYAENYCYFPATLEITKLYRAGKIGEFTYGEGEYIHNCDEIWPSLTYGERDHWRNNMYVTFYCTHSLGPAIHVTGLRPVSVTGFELKPSKVTKSLGRRSGMLAIEIVTFENGGIFKSIHGGMTQRDSIYYLFNGEKGSAESERFGDGVGKCIYCNEKGVFDFYIPKPEVTDVTGQIFEHGGSDFYTMHYFIQKIRNGDPEKNSIDVYEAMDMYLPGIMAYKSILAGGIPMEVPNFRNKADRDKYRFDTMSFDKKVAGDMLVPSYSKEKEDDYIPDEVYEKVKKMWEEEKKSAYKK